MISGKIYCNGVLVDPQRERLDAEQLLCNNYVYARINTVGHKPLYLQRHLHYAALSFEKLYGRKPSIDTDKISFQIGKLLYENRLPRTGNIVTIYIVPRYGENGRGRQDIIITTGITTIYRRYEVLSVRPKAIIANYEIPFAEHRTAVSMAASGYMEEFAARAGAKTALRANRTGNLVSAGDYPVFAVQKGVVITPEPSKGAGESVEYELMLRVCERAGVEVGHRDIPVEELSETDELMAFNHTGIQSILSCGEIFFYNLTAIELDKQLQEITDEGLS